MPEYWIGQQETKSLDVRQNLGMEKKTGIEPGIIALVKKRRLIDNTEIRDWRLSRQWHELQGSLQLEEYVLKRAIGNEKNVYVGICQKASEDFWFANLCHWLCEILSLYSLFHLSIYTFMLNFRNVSFKESIMFIFVSKVLYISDRMSKIHVFFFNTIHKNKLKMD